MATATALIHGSNLPRTAIALQRIRPRPKSLPWWRTWFRTRPVELMCDHCGRAMIDFMPLRAERICIRCVAEMRTPLATPEIAGAAAVLRTLFLEAELEWQAQSVRPFRDDKRRIDAILATAELVLWWLTPPNLRRPDTTALGEHSVLEVVANFDRTWKLRSTTQRSLMGVFAAWRDRQLKAQRHAELAAVDKRYAALIAAERA